MRLASLAALALLAAAPLPAQDRPSLPAPGRWPDLHPAQASEDLVQAFAEFYRENPIGSTLAPSRLRVLSTGEAAGLPALPAGQRYAEIEGLIVKIDAAYRLVGIARRAPTTTAAAPEPAPASDATATANANATATVNITINENGDDEEEDEGDEDDRSAAISVAEAEARGIRIPGGHRPEPGACRLWIPGTPPGRQPRGEVSCDEDDLPEGALLIRG